MPDSRLRSGIAIANLRAMPTLAIVFGLILEAMGIGAYFLSGAQSVTALIPSFFGSVILLSGVVGLLIPSVVHAAAALAHCGCEVDGVVAVGTPNNSTSSANDSISHCSYLVRWSLSNTKQYFLKCLPTWNFRHHVISKC